MMDKISPNGFCVLLKNFKAFKEDLLENRYLPFPTDALEKGKIAP